MCTSAEAFKPLCTTWRDIRGLDHEFYCKSSDGGADEGAKVARIEDDRFSGRSRLDGFLFEGLKGGSGESLEDEAQLGHQLLGLYPCI